MNIFKSIYLVSLGTLSCLLGFTPLGTALDRSNRPSAFPSPATKNISPGQTITNPKNGNTIRKEASSGDTASYSVVVHRKSYTVTTEKNENGSITIDGVDGKRVNVTSSINKDGDTRYVIAFKDNHTTTVDIPGVHEELNPYVLESLIERIQKY